MGGWIEDESWIGDPSNILGNTPVFGGTCIFRGRAGPGTPNFEHVAKYPAHIKHLQVNSVNLAHVSVDLATTITWMRKIWGNMCWYVHKFRQGRYRSPKIATQTFGPKKIRFQKVLFFRCSETHKTRDVLTTTKKHVLCRYMKHFQIWKSEKTQRLKPAAPLLHVPPESFCFKRSPDHRGNQCWSLEEIHAWPWKTWWRRVA